MDDLVELEWCDKPEQQKNNTASSSYNFDALLRSMPSSSRQDASSKPQSASVSANRAPMASKNESMDAFASLLPSFGQAQKEQRKTTPSVPQANSHVKEQKSQDIWGLDAFESMSASTAGERLHSKSAMFMRSMQSISPSAAPSSKYPTEDDLLADFRTCPSPPTPLPTAPNDGADLLGDLSKPVQSQPAKESSTCPEERPLTTSSSSPTKQPTGHMAPSPSRSPPPHIVGQLVEMGFGPVEAREALAQTSSGQDVQQAADTLIASQPPPPTFEFISSKSMKEDGDDRRRTSRMAPAETRTGRPTPAQPSFSNPFDPATKSFQQQADQLYSQASTLGTSMLKNANAWWDSAKAQARKAMDEARGDGQDVTAMSVASGLRRHALRRWGGRSSSQRPVDYDATPRWMSTVPAPAESPSANVSSSSAAPRKTATECKAKADIPTQPASVESNDVLLLGDECDPASSRPTPPAAAGRSTKHDEPAARASSSAPSSTASPALQNCRHERTIAPEDTTLVNRATHHKDQGNMHFLRGAYADAEEQYTKALDLLPHTSLWRIPLLNNRANVRLKNGNSAGASADCTASINLIVLPSMQGGIYRPSQDALPASHASLILREAYAKSVSQRARAYEAVEKYALAKQDWDKLARYERAEGSGVKSGETHRRAAMDGIARCERMLNPTKPSIARFSLPTHGRAQASSRSSLTTDSDGMARMRAIRQAQDEEDAQRIAHKDSVDARIQAWTKGKENNVRALLASMDDPKYGLIWEALDWKKIDLHQLITDAQVKRAYTKAIARLHPDKLSSAQTSVEQRMLAAGMFNALNEAFHK